MGNDGEDCIERPRRSARAATACGKETREEEAGPPAGASGRRRAKRSLDLGTPARRELFSKAARVAKAVPGSSMLQAVRAVAVEEGIEIVAADRGAITQGVYRRLKILQDCPSEAEAEASEERDAAVTAAVAALRAETGDRIRKRNMPQAAAATPGVPAEEGGYHGAPSFVSYQEAMRRVLSVALAEVGEGKSLRQAALAAWETLRQEGISVSTKTLQGLLSRSKAAGEVLVPERPGDVAVPSHLEYRLLSMVEDMKQRQLPVFAADVMTWCTELIAGTPAANNFKNGTATESWFRTFLKRHKLTTADIPFSRTAARMSVLETAAVTQPQGQTEAERMARMSREELLHLCRTQAQAIDDLVEALSVESDCGEQHVPATVMQKLCELARRPGNEGAGLARVQEKVEQRRAEEAERQAKLAERDSRREAETAAMVATGERILGEIRQSGLPAVIACTVSDLKGLLKQANPEGAVDSGAKKEALLMRVMALQSVQEALASHFGRPPQEVQPRMQDLLA